MCKWATCRPTEHPSTTTWSRRLTKLTESSVLETKAGPKDCNRTRRISSKHLAHVSFVLRCFEPFFCGFSKLKCVSTVAITAKWSCLQYDMWKACCRQRRWGLSEEFSESIDLDDSEPDLSCESVMFSFESSRTDSTSNSSNVKNCLKLL